MRKRLQQTFLLTLAFCVGYSFHYSKLPLSTAAVIVAVLLVVGLVADLFLKGGDSMEK